MAPTRASIVANARELAQSDVGDDICSQDLKRKVLKAPDTDIGFFVIASAILQNARDMRLVELSNRYREAQSALKAGNYKDAQRIFQSLGDYSDAEHKAEIAASKERDRIAKENEQRKQNEAKYERASNLAKQGKYDQAISAFSELGSFKDSKKRAIELRENEKRYKAAKTKFNQKEYAEAEREFARLGDYRDSRKLSKEANRLRTRDKRRKRAAEINQELAKLKAEERALSEKTAKYEEAKRIMELPEPDEPGCLSIISMTITIMWIIYSIFLVYSLSNSAQLSVDHVPLFLLSTVLGPVITIPSLVRESSQSNKRKEAKKLLESIKKNDDTSLKLSRVRNQIEKYNRELSSLGKDAIS